MNPGERFELIYLHDGFLRHIHVDVQNRICRLELDRAWILKDPPKSMFDYEVYYNPAVLEFTDVKEIRFPDGYCLNGEIADSASKPAEIPNYYCFSMDLTGGRGDEFMRTIEIVAKDFSINGEVCTPPFETL